MKVSTSSSDEECTQIDPDPAHARFRRDVSVMITPDLCFVPKFPQRMRQGRAAVDFETKRRAAEYDVSGSGYSRST